MRATVVDGEYLAVRADQAHLDTAAANSVKHR